MRVIKRLRTDVFEFFKALGESLVVIGVILSIATKEISMIPVIILGISFIELYLVAEMRLLETVLIFIATVAASAIISVIAPVIGAVSLLAAIIPAFIMIILDKIGEKK
mgnify:CR=1 FL=1